jgi:hypothetical protein
MAYADPISLPNHAATDQDFTITSRLQNGSDWVETDATPTDMRTMSIRHSNAGPSVAKGANPIRRHLVQFVHSKWNDSLAKTEKLVLNVTMTVDPGSSFTTTNQQDLVAFANGFFTDTNLAKLLRDET